MASKKTTRRALFSSVISLVLCMAMLVGTTFAWFTDEVVSGINQITAGNLDVELYHSDKAAPNGEKVNEKTVLFDDVTLWEPGAVAYENFVVKNEGNLALKYQMALNFENATDNGNGGTLADVLKVAVVEGGFTGGRVEAQGLTYGYDLSTFTLAGALNANEDSKVYGVVVYWQPTDNDNDYNMNNEHTEVLSIDLGVHLYATQKEHEFDSFGPEYDKESTVFAAYTFESEADLLAFAPTTGDAASSGLSLTDDGKAQIDKSGAWYPADVDLAANGYSIEYDLDITGLAVGQNVTVDTGESVSWGSTPIYIERGSAIVYYGLAKNEKIGTLDGTKLHITHEYTLDAEGKLNIKTTVSDGAESLSYSKSVASAAQTSLYWDIYTVSEAGKATMDNFTFSVFKADINNATELAAALESGVGDSSAVVKLNSDIVLSGTWSPIGDKEAGEYFTGTFDGNGHTISGLSVEEGDYVALIGAAKDAVIKDVTVAGAVSGENPAGIVARVEGSTVVENCVSNVAVSGSTKAGGIACNVTNTGDGEVKFINCVNNGDISGSGTNGLGGIIGYTNTDANVTIENCTNNGNINGSDSQYAGAAIGYAAANGKGSIIAFTNNGTITGKNSLGDALHRYLVLDGVVLAAYCGSPENWNVSFTDENGFEYFDQSGERTLYRIPAEYEEDTVVIPEGVTAIGGYAFAYNSNIETIKLPSSVTTLNDRAFRDTSASTVELNEGLTNISYQAFRNALNVTSVEIPSTVTTISKEAFQNSGIKELEIPANVTTIEYGGCRDMKELETVTIEGNVDIPVYAFRACTNLRTVILKGDDVTFGGGSKGMIFTNKENGDGSAITVYVANETVKERLLAADTAAKDYGGYKIVVADTVSTNDELKATLQNGGNAVLTDDLTVTGSVITTNGVTEAYGNKVGVAQYGGTLDGNGKTLTETGTSAYVIVTHGGTIKNLTIVGGGRGIVIYAPTEDVIIDNVLIDGPGYAINTAEHNGQDLIVTNSTVNGWTSLAGLDSVSFTNCKFGENSTKCWQNYGYSADYDRLIRPYGQAAFTDCTFEKSFYIDLSALANGNKITLTNCNCEGVVLTAENYANYITVELPAWATSIADCIVFC